MQLCVSVKLLRSYSLSEHNDVNEKKEIKQKDDRVFATISTEVTTKCSRKKWFKPTMTTPNHHTHHSVSQLSPVKLTVRKQWRHQSRYVTQNWRVDYLFICIVLFYCCLCPSQIESCGGIIKVRAGLAWLKHCSSGEGGNIEVDWQRPAPNFRQVNFAKENKVFQNHLQKLLTV